MTPIRSGLWFGLFNDLADPRAVMHLAADAEDCGWDGLFVWDHLFWKDVDRPVGDPWITLAGAATVTESLRLGPMVTPVARRRAAKLARETAALDVLSDGRSTLGVGLGSDRFGGEFSRTGEQLDDRRRAVVLDETLSVLRQAWSGEPVDVHGEAVTVADARFLPRPVQRPGVPIWVAGLPGRRRPIERAARHDGFFPVNLEDPQQLAESAAVIAAARSDGVNHSVRPVADVQADGVTHSDPAATALGTDGVSHSVPGAFDLAVAIPPGADAGPWIDAGATWLLTDLDPDDISLDTVRGVLRDGPFT